MYRISIRPRLIALAVLVALGTQPIVLAVEGARQYTVKPGDTLGSISARFGVTQQQLIELNQLPNADLIAAGQTLVLPDEVAAEAGDAAAARSAPAQTASREYVVRPGDSLSTIAASFAVPIAALVEANGLGQPDRISIGQKLMIPGGGTPAAPTGARTGGEHSEVGAVLEGLAASYHVDPALVKALAWYLSSWRVDATSPGGAVGPMQVTANTQEWVSQSILKRQADRANLRDNVEIGVAYLAYLINRLGDERQGVAAYLQGPASIARSGPNPSTTRALDAIYGSRARFAGSAGLAAAIAQPSAPKRDLAAEISAATRGVVAGARVGVAARNLATGERLEWHAGQVFPSASVNKLPIMVEAFRQVVTGKLARTASLNADLERMIALSDNDAANRILDLVGEQSVNSTMASLGLGSTLMRNHFSAGAAQDPGFNQTTPADMAALLTLLASDKLVSAQASAEMRTLLARTQDNSKLVRGLPSGTRIAHKSGWYGGVANDAGIVYGPRASYVVAVFSSGSPDGETGNRLVAEVSRLLYQAWGQ